MSQQFVYFHLYNGATAPTKGTPDSAGWDLFPLHSTRIRPGTRALVDTGVSVMIPRGFYGHVAPRSGLAWKQGIDIGAGIIDADFRGMIGVLLINNGQQDFVTSPGIACAQLIIKELGPELKEVPNEEEFQQASFYATVRGNQGYGSTTVQSALKTMQHNHTVYRQQFERQIHVPSTPNFHFCLNSNDVRDACPWCTAHLQNDVSTQPPSPVFAVTASSRPASPMPSDTVTNNKPSLIISKANELCSLEESPNEQV